MPFVSGPFSHFLFKLNEMTMNLLAVVKINPMTFTDRNLYTYKKIRFPFRNNYTWAENFPGVDNIVCFGIRVSNYTQTHHKIHETLACRRRKLNQNTILGALAINRAAFSYKVEVSVAGWSLRKGSESLNHLDYCWTSFSNRSYGIQAL